MNREKEPLYRKVNTKALHVYHHKGSDAKYDRNTKKGLSTSMKKDVKRGLDYTPLFRFLLSKAGENWDNVFSEAKSRLDKEDPIFWMVDLLNENELLRHDTDIFLTENARYSKLIIDENNLLQLKNPDLKNEDFSPSCTCCTHTFNGKTLIKKYVK